MPSYRFYPDRGGRDIGRRIFSLGGLAGIKLSSQPSYLLHEHHGELWTIANMVDTPKYEQ